MKTLLEHARALPEGDRILAGLGAAYTVVTDGAHASDWLAVDGNVELTRVVLRELGPARASRFWRDVMAQGFKGPLLSQIVAGARSIFGVDVGGFVKLIPHGWRAIYRACGEHEVIAKQPRRAVLRLGALPPVCCVDDVWIGAVRSSFDAFYFPEPPAVPSAGSVTTTNLSLDDRRVDFVFTW